LSKDPSESVGDTENTPSVVKMQYFTQKRKKKDTKDKEISEIMTLNLSCDFFQ